MSVKSLHSFCKQHGIAKSTTHKLCQDLEIDTSKGLNDEARAKLCEVLNLDESSSLKAEAVSSDIVPSSGYGLGSLIPSGNGGAIHLHIHTGDRDYFRQSANRNRGDIAAMIAGMFETQEHQGKEDGLEIEDMAQSIKTEMVKKRLAGMAQGQQSELGNS